MGGNVGERATSRSLVAWKGEAWGHLILADGYEIELGTPVAEDKGLLHAEDVYVAAANSWVMMIFLWACEHFRVQLLSYRCEADGTLIVSDTEPAPQLEIRFQPQISARAAAGETAPEAEGRVRRALATAAKYNLATRPVQMRFVISPTISIEPSQAGVPDLPTLPGPQWAE
jgi:hypothetical protein